MRMAHAPAIVGPPRALHPARTSRAPGKPRASAESVGRGEGQEAGACLHGDQRPERKYHEAALALEPGGELAEVRLERVGEYRLAHHPGQTVDLAEVQRVVEGLADGGVERLGPRCLSAVFRRRGMLALGGEPAGRLGEVVADRACEAMLGRAAGDPAEAR